VVQHLGSNPLRHPLDLECTPRSWLVPMATVTAPHRSIADAAVVLGISPDTLRYYECELSDDSCFSATPEGPAS